MGQNYNTKNWKQAFSLIFVLLAFALPSGAQEESISADNESIAHLECREIAQQMIRGEGYDSTLVEKKLRKRDQKLTIFGYYRLFAYGRNITEPYPNLDPYSRAYGIGDGYREPMLSMNIIGRPNGKTSFGTEIFMFTPYQGGGPADNVFTMNLGLNFYGSMRTKQGSFGIRAGGIHWYNLSSFTIGVFQVLDRFSIFDRTPWEGVTGDEKYENYYATGVTSPGDLRWNNQAFQGFILNGYKLPGDFAFDVFWGKTQPNGGLPNGLINASETIEPTLDYGSVPGYLGINGTARVLPNYITGGKLSKTFGQKRNTISYNLIHSQTALDTLHRQSRKYQVHTLSLDLNFGEINVSGELGGGFYESQNYAKKWGEALMLRFKTPKSLTYLPFDLQVYQISKDFFNPNGEIQTNSNPEIRNDFGIAAGTVGIGGQIPVVNQLIHNRRGVNLNTELEMGKLKLNVGWGVAEEIEPTAAILTYVHRVNGLALSRIYNPFPANATSPTVFGPYGRKVSFFRGVTEGVQTTDLDPATARAINKKYFNAIDVQAKYKLSVNDRAMYFFYIGSFGSAKSEFNAFPSLNDESYLFVDYHEFDVYYELFPDFLITGYLGLENARGGQNTQWDETSGLPLDQFGTGIGVGFDWTLSENSGLYVRRRWMDFEDRSFSLDRYKGHETTIELKTFF